jgi:hypothetical protein
VQVCKVYEGTSESSISRYEHERAMLEKLKPYDQDVFPKLQWFDDDHRVLFMTPVFQRLTAGEFNLKF